MTEQKSKFVHILKSLYFYLVSFACVIVFIIGAVTLINTALQTWVFESNGNYYGGDVSYNCTKESMKMNGLFTNKDECMKYYQDIQDKDAQNQRNRDISFGIAMAVVSLPIWVLHMYLAKAAKKEED